MTPDGSFAITVPQGSLSQTYVFRLRPPSASESRPFEAGFVMIGHLYNIEALDSAGNLVRPIRFSPSASVCMTYTAQDLAAAGGDPGNFRIRFFDDTLGRWMDLQSLTLDSANSKVCAPLEHLTLFALFAKAPNILPTTGSEIDTAWTPPLTVALVLIGGLVWFAIRRRAVIARFLTAINLK